MVVVKGAVIAVSLGVGVKGEGGRRKGMKNTITELPISVKVKRLFGAQRLVMTRGGRMEMGRTVGKGRILILNKVVGVAGGGENQHNPHRQQ